MVLYVRVAEKKQKLLEQMNGIQQSRKRLSKDLKKTLYGLMNRISDLDKIENELTC